MLICRLKIVGNKLCAPPRTVQL